MAIDTTSRRSRRALLAGTVGGLAAVAAQALGRPAVTQATHGDVHLGTDNPATLPTSITNTGSLPAFMGRAIGDGQGVRGFSTEGIGVFGESHSNVAVYGTSQSHIGVYGSTGSGPAAVYGFSELGAIGVFGNSTAGPGVRGESEKSIGVRAVGGTTGLVGTGPVMGVRGASDSGIGISGGSGTGFGVRAESSAGIALQAIGRVRFDKASGRATVPANTDRVTVSPGFAIAGTTVLATLLGDAGGATCVKRVATSSRPGGFTIHLTAPASQDVPVGWFVISPA